MRARDFLIEGTLTPQEIFGKHLNWRPAALIAKLQANTPFVDSLGPNANEYIPAPGEYERLQPLIDAAMQARLANPNAKIPSLTLKYSNKIAPNSDPDAPEQPGEIPFSKLEKNDLQTAKGKATTDVNVQPLGIGIAAPKVSKDTPLTAEIKTALDSNSAILGADLFQVIADNTVLDQAGDLGVAIKKAANEITEGIFPDLREYDDKMQKSIAIDAGEYLGILMMVHGLADWHSEKYDAFLKYLGAGDLSNLLVIFPGSQNSQLQDSYGVQNTETGHTIMISSKGGIGNTAVGAAPALSGLKIPSKMTKKVAPGSAVEFLQLMQRTSTINQPFAAMNFLNMYYPDAVPDLYKGLLPFTQTDIANINANIKGQVKLDSKYRKIVKSRNIKARATAGGILMYATAKDLVDTFNNNQPIPDFRQVILKILDMNFVQIFSRVIGGKLRAKVLWPGNIDGNVYLWTKAEAAAPSSAGFSFKVTD